MEIPEKTLLVCRKPKGFIEFAFRGLLRRWSEVRILRGSKIIRLFSQISELDNTLVNSG